MARIWNVTQSSSGAPVVPNRGRFAAVSIWADSLPADSDLNSLETLIDGKSASQTYLGCTDQNALQQLNCWLPDGVRTGLLPVELRWNGRSIVKPRLIRAIPAPPLIPHIVLITDGMILTEHNRSTQGQLKVHVSEVPAQAVFAASVDDKAVLQIRSYCADPRVPRHEIDIELPRGLESGQHTLQLGVGRNRTLFATFAVL